MKKLLGIIVFSFFFNNLGLSNEKYICIEKKPNTVAKYNLHKKSTCPDRENFVFKIYKNKYPASFNKLDIYYITKWRSSEPDVDAFGIDIINMTKEDKIFDFDKGEIVLMPNVILNKKIVKKSVNGEFSAFAIGQVGISSNTKNFTYINAVSKQKAFDGAIVKCRTA